MCVYVLGVFIVGSELVRVTVRGAERGAGDGPFWGCVVGVGVLRGVGPS